MNVKNAKWHARKAIRTARRPFLAAYYQAKKSGFWAIYAALMAAALTEKVVAVWLG